MHRWHSGEVVVSQEKGSWFQLRLVSLHALPVQVYSEFLLQSKSMHVRLTGDSKLSNTER